MWGRGFQICGYFLPPTLRSRDTAHAQYDFWPKHVLLNNAYGIYIVDGAKQYCKHLIFGMLLNQTGTAELQIFAKWGLAYVT